MIFQQTQSSPPLTNLFTSPDDLAIAEQVLRERGFVEEKNDGTACPSERYRQSLEGVKSSSPPTTPKPFRGL